MLDFVKARMGVNDMDKYIEELRKNNPNVDMTTILINAIALHQDSCGFGKGSHQSLASRKILI